MFTPFGPLAYALDKQVKRMTKQTIDQAVAAAAIKHQIPYANLRAVVEVESNGVTYALVNGKQEPLIRWEGHYFDARLTDAQRTEARRLKLASPKAQAIPNPRSQEDRWNKLLIPAININRQAAYESCSYGLGQVMGSHWKSFGYSDIMDLVDLARSGVGGQIELMLQYCVVNNLIDELQRGDFTGFARGYNGPNFAKFNYDGKMRDAAKRFAKTVPTPIPYDDAIPTVVIAEPSNMFSMGSKGLRVREIQALLLRAGHAIKIDGDFGPATKDAIIEFQIEHGLKTDGIVGPLTWRALDEYRVEDGEQPGKVSPTDAVTETPEGRQGALIAIVGTLIAGASNAAPETLGAILAGIGVLIALAGAGFVGYGYLNANALDDDDGTT